MKNVAVAIAAILAAISLYLLASASANTTGLFSDLYPFLLAINGIVTITLAATVIYQLIRLWREYRNQRFGSRLKYRMVMMFAFMAILPGLVVYAVSLQFVVRSIESWFDVRVDSALEGGLALGQNALDYLVDQLKDKAAAMSLDVENQAGISVAQLNRLREWAGVGSVTVFGANGQVLVSAIDGDTARLFPDSPQPHELRRAFQERGLSVIEDTPDGRLVIRVLVPLEGRGLAKASRLLQLTQPVPETFSLHAGAVQEAYRDYQELTLARSSLKRIYSLTLTLTLLVALFAAIAVAFILARRLAAPLRILAEGTEAVAQGDFSPRRALPARDELGILTHSFNQMTHQLEEARAQAEKNRLEVESARAYLESVLTHLSAGVLVFSAKGVLRAANRGALDILADELGSFEDIALADWPRHTLLRDALLEGFTKHEGDWQVELEILRPDSSPMILLIHGSRLPESTGGGLVAVLDDITRLIEAQRTAAWAEVARRLAHEIKNPLTPIQLSAERLAFKLSSELDEVSRQILERSTQTIVNQVEAVKNLINAFRDYARLPTPTLTPLDLGELIREILVLYESMSAKIILKIPTDLPQVMGDASQIRQIVHNMLQNALDALVDEDNAEIVIEAHGEGDWVLLSCQDNGPGFPPEVLAHAFEPYFTTKAKGTGLGLAMIKKIVTEHGGEVKIANRDGGGAGLRVRLRVVMTNNEL
ncbi:MAG: ATP-binding protein [Betaproteobacteria bacterium]|jgi:nitrogen fixation/metabolism regulation signal transduction histidine kinase|nr:ATP-binding protein [Betaproteobacteria bacterium]